MEYNDFGKSELDSLIKSIDNIKRKYVFNYIGMFFGAIIIIFVILSYAFDRELLEGMLSMIFIGSVIVFMNYIELRSRMKRVQQLTKDLNKMKELYETIKYF